MPYLRGGKAARADAGRRGLSSLRAREERRMSRPPFDVDAELEASLRRIDGAVRHNRLQYAAMVEQIMADTHADVARRLAEKSDDLTVRLAERQQRRLDRLERRRQWRLEQQSREAASGVPRGIVFLVAAVVCVTFALRD